MRRMLTKNLVPGMKLANPIYTSDGMVLLGKGVELKAHYIERLIQDEIMSVFIEDDISQGIEVQDVISDPVRVEAIAAIKDITADLKVGKPADSHLAKLQINAIVDELSRSKDIVVNLVDIRGKSNYIFYHMVNVAVLSILTGISLGYDELRLRDLGVGALMHDVGMLRINEKVYNKPASLSAEEYEQVKQHAQHGFAMVRDMDNMNVLCAHIAFQHHERYDGKGYPRKLAGTDIHEYARIVAIANVYDAMVSDRPHRPAMLPGQAVEYLLAMAGTQFDPDLVRAFVEHIAIFPVGCVVELSTKEKAIVLFVGRHDKTRPVIRIFADAQYRKLAQPIELDLMTHPSLFITRIIDY
jgi:HD-GYP domain-containing protein (c-di-GMP phosphodiesterase class II)